MARNGIDFQFLRVFDELADDDRVFLGYSRSLLKKSFKFVIAGSHAHGGAAEDIGRSHKDGVADFAGKRLGIFKIDEFLPFRLLDAEPIQ